MKDDLLYRDEVYAIQGAVYEVYKTLGNGFREEVAVSGARVDLAENSI